MLPSLVSLLTLRSSPHETHTPPPPAPALSPAAIAALYQNCLKLASENKITAKNTWALPLIDHLSDLVAADAPHADGGDGENANPNSGTDFQRASLTLAAGVSIYAHRVDAVHGDVFKILGGLGRGGMDDENGGDGEDGENGENGNNGNGGRRNNSRRRNNSNHDADPSSTLDSLENIDAKKFDLAFAVDPLFQRTAALFDEGGAAGLLLNSLPLLGGPALAFDSAAVPCAVDAGAARAGTVGGSRARLPLGCLSREAANALRALANPAATRPCPAQLALAEAAGRAVLAPGGDGGAQELVAGVVAEIEAAEREAAAERRRSSGVEAEEAAEEEQGEGSDDEDDDEEEEEGAASAGGGWPELERAMAAADRAAAAAAAAAPPPPVSPSSPAAFNQQQQQMSDDDDDDDFGGGGGFGGGDGGFDDEVEEEAGAARAAAAAAAGDSSPVLGGGGAPVLRDQDGDGEPIMMTPGTPASPAVVAGSDGRGFGVDDPALRFMLAAAGGGTGEGGLRGGASPSSSSQQVTPIRGISRAGDGADDEPPPTHAKAWAGAAHWRHRAARAARAGVLGQEHEDGGGENGDFGIGGGMFGAPTPLQNRSRGGGNPLTSSSSLAGGAGAAGTAARPGALDFGRIPPLNPRALSRAPLRLTTLRAIRARAETLLPDDVHYSPSALSRLFDAPETTPAAAAAAAAAGAAAAARRRLEGNEDGRRKEREEEEEEETLRGGGLGGGGLGGSDSEDEEEGEAATAAARAIATAAITAATQQQEQGQGGQQQTAAAKAAEAALLHSSALPDPNAPQQENNPFFSSSAAAGWGGTAPADGSAAAVAAARAAAAAAAGAGSAPMAYARAAKRVDVRALKVALWAEAREAAAEQQQRAESAGDPAASSSPLLFSELVSRVADCPRGRAAAPPGQLSPHLVFICLLHLCNEHSLELGRTTLPMSAAACGENSKKKLQPAVSLGGGADLTVAGVEVE